MGESVREGGAGRGNDKWQKVKGWMRLTMTHEEMEEERRKSKWKNRWMNKGKEGRKEEKKKEDLMGLRDRNKLFTTRMKEKEEGGMEARKEEMKGGKG